jgi:hypothetical protein
MSGESGFFERGLMTPRAGSRGSMARGGRFRHAILLAAALAALVSTGVWADEAGVSFWACGQYASFAAQPYAPGFNLAVTYYAYNGSGDRSFGMFNGRHLLVGVHSVFNSLWLTPTYTPETKLFGGTLSFSLTGLFGYNRQSGSVQLQPAGFYAARGQSLTSGGDLYPQVLVAWSEGKHSWMTYLMGDVPCGSYNPDRYAEIGLGHWAADLGGAYTYFDEASGLEFSATLGFTYNWKNPDTEYQSGIDAHLDLGASKTLGDGTLVGLVGYVYRQLTADSGQGAEWGPFYSSATALGAQIGHTFTLGGTPVNVNLRGYYDVQADHRAQSYTVYLVASLPIGGNARK